MDLILCWVMAVALCAAPLALSQECEGFSRHPNDTVVAERGMACLYCDYPSVEDIVWVRGSTSIETGTDTTVCNCRASTSPGQPISLCFDSVQREDADRYICRAQVNFGDVRDCSARLILAGAPNITRREPANANIVIANGNSQSITVHFNPGNPIAMAQWSKDGQLINDSRVITAPNSTTLTLTNNDATIRGRYLVNVSNIGGSDTFQYNVKAEFAPVINLTIAPLDPNHVRLTCSARGYPRLDSVAWNRASGGSAVSGSVDQINGEESAMFDFSLTSTLDRERSQCDGVVYRCTVTQGSTRKSTSITCQIAVPPVPQNLEITVLNSTAVLVDWTGSDTAVSYDVQYRLRDSAYQNPPQRTAAPPLIIGNLVEGKTYYFRVRSRSSTRISDFIPEKMATICRAPSTEVTGVEAKLDSVGRRRAIRMSWQRSSESGVVGYLLNVVSPNALSTVNINGQDNTSYILVPSLCDNIRFSMFVRALNSCGIPGPQSATVQVRCFSPNRILIRNLIPYDKGITVNWDSDRMDLLVNVLITVEQQASSGTESLTYNISDVTANEGCVGGLKLETNYKVCINATYHDLDDMQQDCNFTTTSSQLNPTNNGIQCSLPNTSTTTTTGTPQRSPIIADWVIAVIVVGLLMVIAALFCFIGLCCACRNSDQKGSYEFDSDSSIHTNSVRDGPMREMSPTRSCLKYHVKGHSVNWNEHVDTLRQMDTGGTSV